MFPTLRPVTLENMNYASVVAAGIAVFALGWWWAGARKTYTGPRTKDLFARIGDERDGSREEDCEHEDRGEMFA